MKRLIFGAAVLLATPAASAQPATPASAPIVKNWTAPAYKIKGQALVDTFFAQHPELLNMTFHGRPPTNPDVFTMFAGTFPERIGKVSSPHDTVILDDGLISVGVRYKSTDDPKKVVVMIPLKDKTGKDIAVAVFAFRDNVLNEKASGHYVSLAIQLRDELTPQIESLASLFNRS